MLSHFTQTRYPLLTRFLRRQMCLVSKLLPPHKEGKIKVLDAEINVCETVDHEPSAKPIFCLPGVFGSIEMDFKPIMHEFNRKKYKWICYDPPGYGKSRPPERFFRTPQYECANIFDVDYIQEIMNMLGHPKYVLLAWGGATISAITISATQPGKVAGVITCGGYRDVPLEVVPMLENLREMGIEAIQEPRKSQLLAMYGHNLLFKMWIDWCNECIAMATSKTFKVEGSFQHVTDSVKCPTLVIYGRQDALVPVSASKSLRKSLEHSRLYLVEEGTHSMHLGNTQEFVENIQRFVDQC